MQARFCTRCGRELQEGTPCSCQSTASVQADKLTGFLARLGLTKSKAEKRTLFETGVEIVPDVVKPTDGEVAIKQYPIATLRSRIKGEYAKGRLQVTNKRVLFRGVGFSYSGRIALQHEFAIDEIAGIDDAVNFGRSLGIKFMVGLQNVEQLYESYGEERARSILSGFMTSISFRVNDAKSREYIQGLFGKNQKLESYLPTVQSKGVVESQREANVVEDWDITHLKTGQAIIGLPEEQPFLFQFDRYSKETAI